MRLTFLGYLFLLRTLRNFAFYVKMLKRKTFFFTNLSLNFNSLTNAYREKKIKFEYFFFVSYTKGKPCAKQNYFINLFH